MRAWLLFLPIAVVVSAWAAEAPKPKKIYVAVVDFAGPESLGKQLADSVRLKLRRYAEYEVIDPLSTAQATAPLDAGEDHAKVTSLMKDKLGVNLILYGTCTADGAGASAHVSCIDLTGKEPRTWHKVFDDDTERARGLLSTQIVEELRSESQWRPPEYGDESEPKNFGKPLNASGDFESPAGWEAPDRVSTFVEPGKDVPSKILRVRTDLERDAWLEYQRKLRLGQTDPSHAPKLAADKSYDSVAGIEGVHFSSRWIDAKGGQRYWLAADMKGKTTDFFFPKIFVKGYADFSASADGLPELSLVERKLSPADFAAMPPAKRKALIAEDSKTHPDRYRREVYRWFLSCRNLDGNWQHYAAPFPPRGGLPANVQWFQVQVYAYWPPGEYLFDNVNLYADPNQTGPLPEESARTANYDQTRQRMERAMTQPAGK